MVDKGAVLATVTAIQETLAAFGVPGASVLERLATAAYEKRVAAARDIFIETLRREGLNNLRFAESDADDLVQMLMRFTKASEEGAARHNLKLLAQVIVGLKRNVALEFDKFQTYANVL
jgi:hypothetical protein